MYLVESYGVLLGRPKQPAGDRDYPDLDQPGPRRPHFSSVDRRRAGRIFEGLLGRMGEYDARPAR